MALFHIHKPKKARRSISQNEGDLTESTSESEGENNNRRTSRKFQNILEKYRLAPASQSSSSQQDKSSSNIGRGLIRANNLVIVPLSVLEQWKDEIEKHSKPGTITVMKYYEKSSRNTKLEDYDVVLTTYDILGAEFHNKGKFILELNLFFLDLI